MKFTISWLKEHLDTQKSDQELIDSLTNIGLEVEDVVNASEIFSNFIVAQVVEEKKHPNADKLKVCRVDIGSDVVDVVCGAPNVEKDMKVVYAPPGSTIPSTQMKLKASKIRGVESLGMMCSEFELGISDDHDGIIKLDDSVKVGQPYAEIAGLNDTMIEIGITPNRQDCLGVSGIARDLSAAGLGTLNKKKIKVFKSKKYGSKNTHGTGCTLSSAIATYLSCGKDLIKSCELGIKYVNESIKSNLNFGKGNGPINHLNSFSLKKKFY